MRVSNETTSQGDEMISPITIARKPSGLRTAQTGDYKVVALAHRGDGFYSVQRRQHGQWQLLPDGETIPLDVERALCRALNVECKR